MSHTRTEGDSAALCKGMDGFEKLQDGAASGILKNRCEKGKGCRLC
jgi:hypothetical protein